MSRIDFYQLGRDPVERVVCLLAAKACETGARLVVFHSDEDRRGEISEALWKAEGFLANGMAGEADEARQPILLAANPPVANTASIAIAADGQWRGVIAGTQRNLLLFPPEKTAEARALWRELSGTQGHALHIFKQGPDGAWREGR